MRFGGDLDQAELGAIGVFRNKLSVEGDQFATGEFGTKLAERVDRIYCLVLQR